MVGGGRHLGLIVAVRIRHMGQAPWRSSKRQRLLVGFGAKRSFPRPPALNARGVAPILRVKESRP